MSLLPKDAEPPAPDRRALAAWLARRASAELAHLRRIRGPGRRTARRIARARRVLALAGALVGSTLASDARAGDPLFLDPFAPFGLADVGQYGSPEVADLDGDGDLDAFVGNLNGDTIYFRNTGTASAPAFAAPVTNPFGLVGTGDVGFAGKASPALADLDGDGDLDALVGEGFGSTLFFANTGTATSPAFAAPSTNPFGLADAGGAASPAFADLDGDGDLDLLVGTVLGDAIFFQNTGTPTAPAFAASSTNPFGLADPGAFASPDFADLDGDGDLDLLVGTALGNAVLFQNTGTASAPAFAAPIEPPGLTGASYSTPSLADLDGDGDLDVLLGGSLGLTFFLENSGTQRSPRFAPAVTDAFGIPDVGDIPTPAFGDLDGDGDLDALFGNTDGDVNFLENTGDAASPAFGTPMLDPFGLEQYQRYFSSPGILDIDGDGDLDVMLGSSTSMYAVHLFKNTGTASEPAFFGPIIDPFGPTNEGGAPGFADIDGDGDLDAFVGEYDGEIDYSENTGSPTAPLFGALQDNPFGLTDVGKGAYPTFADLDGDGDFDALVGSYDGLMFFRNTGTATAPAFATPLTAPFGLPIVYAAAPALADIDGDGDFDAFVGNVSQTLFFRNLSAPCPPAPDTACQSGFAKGSLSVSERKPGQEKLRARILKGPALAQLDFGNPLEAGGTRVALCIYDDRGVRVARLEVDRAGELCGAKPCWKPIGKAPPDGQGFSYKDKLASQSGVASFSLKGGAEDHSSLACSAANQLRKGRAELRSGIAAALADAASVTLQVQSSAGACFEVTLFQITEQTPERFKAH